MSRSRTIAWIGGWTCIAACVAMLAVAGDGKSYGEPLSVADPISIGELLSSPSDYVDKSVKVEGLVVDVCPMKGCWMILAEPNEKAQEIRIKVDDGVIVFPMDAKGRPAVAEGVFTKRELTLTQTVGYLKHEADERGKAFDADSVTEPMTVYQIQGTGAVIR